MNFHVPGIFEILSYADAAPTKAEKISMLRRNQSEALKMVLQGAYDKRLVWDLPAGKTPYKPHQGVGIEHALYRQTTTLYMFVVGGIEGMPKQRREIAWVQMLESLHPRDAELMDAIKDKYLPYESLTAELIAEAFPEWKVQIGATRRYAEDTPTEIVRTSPALVPSAVNNSDIPVALNGDVVPTVPAKRKKASPGQGKRNAAYLASKARKAAAEAEATKSAEPAEYELHEAKLQTLQQEPVRPLPADNASAPEVYSYDEDPVVIAQGLVPNIEAVKG